MNSLIALSLIFLNIFTSESVMQDKQFLAAATNVPIQEWALHVSTAQNLACQDDLQNNILHKLAMRKDDGSVFLAGVRLCVFKNYHQLLVQKNKDGQIPLEIAMQRRPEYQDHIEQSFYSAILHPDDKNFDQPDKYFWSRLSALLYMHDACNARNNNLRSKPY